MTPHEQAVLDERATTEARIVAEIQPPVNLADYVREAFDGVHTDAMPDMNFLNVPDEERDADQAEAERVIAAALSARFHRPCTRSELVKLGIAVVSEWQRRRVAAEEAASESYYESLSGNPVRPFAEND